MSALTRYLVDGPFRHSPGNLVPVTAFVCEFINALPFKEQLYWCTAKRVEGALKGAGYPIGQTQYGLAIANLTGPGVLGIVAHGLQPFFKL